ncbi:MAG: anthranilate phosphoribosyltransferase [Bacillota bacterium]|nr:anthranilate phosphoribosyltransferase [Bacillota bacterium]
MIKTAIQKLVTGENLSRKEVIGAMDMVMGGGATPAQISAFLTALRMKGETIEEITGCAQVMKNKATHIQPNVNAYIDLVGTGGDGVNTFNISTTAAFVAAAAGVPIAKHGNRAISSRSGSIDVLEALGINVMLPPEKVQLCVEKCGIGFMFARTFHPAMKNVSVVRGELGIRSVFNILGPISNPSDAKRQVIGVFDKTLTHPIANVMLNMGVERGMVLCCEGIDELTTTAPNTVSEIKDGKIFDYIITASDLGFHDASAGDIKGGTAEENAAITLSILGGEKGAKRDTVLMNAGAAIYIAGFADSLENGIKAAAEAIDSGKALGKLKEVVKFTNEI